jgi:hypothetical protein
LLGYQFNLEFLTCGKVCFLIKKKVMKFIKPFIVAFLQIAMFVGLYKLLLFVFNASDYNYNSNLAWGISVRFGLYVFIVISLFINYTFLLNLKDRTKHGILILGIIIFSLFYITDFTYTPYKVLMLIFCAITGLLSKYLFDKLIFKSKP